MSENYTPRRRGRPPKADKPEGGRLYAGPSAPAASPPDTPPPANAAAPTKRRRRASVGGFNLKLAAPVREGFQRRWVNDIPGRLAYMEDMAYTHVTEQGIKSDSPDSRVRRLVGTQANGQPLYSYLMETPLEEYQHGVEEKEEAHRVVDEHIQAGRDATGRVQDAYGHGEIKAS